MKLEKPQPHKNWRILLSGEGQGKQDTEQKDTIGETRGQNEASQWRLEPYN